MYFIDTKGFGIARWPAEAEIDLLNTYDHFSHEIIALANLLPLRSRKDLSMEKCCLCIFNLLTALSGCTLVQ
jgi:hypothetical protein